MKAYYLILKDLKVESRRGFEIISLFLFVLVASFLISQSSYFMSRKITIPAFWLTIIFVSVFVSTTTFVREIDSKTIFGLKLLPISPLLMFISKTAFTYILVISQGFFGMLFLALFSSNWKIFSITPLFIVFSFYLSSVSSFSSALVMYSEGRSFLIPMLIFIFVAPIILTVLKSDVFTLLLESIVLFLTFIALFEFVIEI